MQHYQDVLQDRSGNAIAGAIVTITDHTTGSPAVVYSNYGGTIVLTSIVTDANGTYSFYANTGRYDMAMYKNGTLLKTVYDVFIGIATTTIINPQEGIAVQNSPYITVSETLPESINSLSVGPLTLSPGVVVTVPSTSRWVIA